MTKKTYDEKDIERFAGLAGVRKKPSMYVGPMTSEGLWTIFREPADNGVDRALAGANDTVHLVIDSKPNTYWVLDHGDGIPVGKKEFEDERGRKEKLSTLYVVTGLTHAGKNFGSEEASRGTHGIGLKATNALSKYFKVWTFRDKGWHCIEYSQGKVIKDVAKTTAPKLPHGLKATKGTVVCFQPDTSLFEKGSSIEKEVVTDWCKLTAYLVPKLTVLFTNAKGKTKKFYSKEGPAAYIAEKAEKLEVTLTDKMFVCSTKNLDVAVQFSDAEGYQVDCYTNGLLNSGGGEHNRALVDALHKSLKPYAGKDPFTANDICEGLVGLVNYKIAAPKFNNQVKEKLIDDRVYDSAFKEILAELEAFWKKNKSMAKSVVSRAALLRKKTSEFLKSKKLIKNVKAAKAKLPAKLADVDGKTPIEKRELYLVEGDSAGGTAKRARDRNFQAVFSLKGKPLNVMETTMDKVNANAEIASILAGLGLELDGKKGGTEIRYGKIISLADPDVDGSHISTLVLTVLWKFVPSAFKAGKVYLLASPEYMSRYKGKMYFGDSKDEIYKQAGTKKLDIQHIKGWGEINADDLADIAFDVNSRKLIQVLPPKDKNGNLRFERLMGKKSQFRKELMGVA